MAEPDIPTVVLDQVATPDWANAVASAINSLDNRTTAVEAWNADTRISGLGNRMIAAEADIDDLEEYIGARHTFKGEDSPVFVSNGDDCPFDTQQYRHGVNVGDFTRWTTTSSGVYAISWSCQISPTWRTKLVVASAIRGIGAHDGGSATTYGSWTGYIGAGSEIWVICTGTGTVRYYDGYCHITKVH